MVKNSKGTHPVNYMILLRLQKKNNDIRLTAIISNENATLNNEKEIY